MLVVFLIWKNFNFSYSTLTSNLFLSACLISFPSRDFFIILNDRPFCRGSFETRILFEIEGVDRAMAEEAFRNAGHKLPIKTKLVERRVI